MNGSENSYESVERGRPEGRPRLDRSVREDQTALHPVPVPWLAAEEQWRGVAVLDHEQPVVTTEPEMRRREPFDSPAKIPRQEGLVVLDAEEAGFPMRRERDAAKSTSEVWDKRTVASARIHDDVAVIHPGARWPLIRVRAIGERERLAHAKRAAAFTLEP